MKGKKERKGKEGEVMEVEDSAQLRTPLSYQIIMLYDILMQKFHDRIGFRDWIHW
jgi:hypothetical protein